MQLIQRTFAETNRNLTLIMHAGRPAMLVPELEAALGYEPKKLTNMLRREWVHELVEGEDFTKVEGGALAALKNLLNETGPVLQDQFKHAPSITLLYEGGINLVLLKTEKPLGVKLRRWLATEVLPSLRQTGSYSTNRPTIEPAELDQRVALIESLVARAADPKVQARLMLVAARMVAKAPLLGKTTQPSGSRPKARPVVPALPPAPDPWKEALEKWLDGRKEVTSVEIWRFLGLKNSGKVEQTRMGRVMIALGYTRRRRRRKDRSQSFEYYYFKP